MSRGLVCFGRMVEFVTPIAVVLSHSIGDLGCGHPISIRVWQRGTIVLAHLYNPANLASAAQDITNLMTCAIVRTGPLILGIGSSSESMMCTPARDRALGTLRPPKPCR